MFTDPQEVTINAVLKSLPRTQQVGQSAIYSFVDETFKLSISHTLSKGRVRSMVRLDQRAIVPDPLTSVNDFETLGEYFVIDRPQVGFTIAQIQQHHAGLVAWASSGAIAKLVGGES